MQFVATTFPEVLIIQPKPRVDERGFLTRTYCEQEFAAQGLNTKWVQQNHTLTKNRGCVRGMHFQADPAPEIKLVRCLSGSVFDVVIDVRRNSPTFGRWEAFELSSENMHSLYIPAGFAHGFQCLEDSCELFYLMSEYYHSELACGVRWNDSEIGIPWPLALTELSERDQELPNLMDIWK